MLLLFAEVGFAAQTYSVRAGDSLNTIAQKFGVSVTSLRRANGLTSSTVNPGRTLTVPSNQRSSSEPEVYGVSTRDLDVELPGRAAASLAKGDHFTVLAREGSRYNVKLQDGRTGWVKADAVTLDDTRKPTPISDTWGIRRGIAQMALAYRGAPYVSGGTGEYGFDCSGFVKFLYAKQGIKLPHESRAMFNCGTPVSRDNLQAGDILFFVNTYRRGISHVGLYIGDNKFIHASTHRSGVKVSDLDEAYYRGHYFGAKRIQQ